MTADKKPVPEIDIEKLRTSFNKARQVRINKEKQFSVDAKAQKIIDDDKLFTTIIKTINERLLEAAKAEQKTIVVWSMGEFGHRNSSEVTEETPINWEVFARVEQFCKASGLVTKRETVKKKEAHSSYTSYELHASWT